jgi:hypothetical protein
MWVMIQSLISNEDSTVVLQQRHKDTHINVYIKSMIDNIEQSHIVTHASFTTTAW